MRRLSWLLTIPLAVVLVVFAVANRQPVEISLWPFSLAVVLPVFLLALGTLALGALGGALLVWVPSLAWRHRARTRQRRVEALEAELATLKARPAEPSVPSVVAAPPPPTTAA